MVRNALIISMICFFGCSFKKQEKEITYIAEEESDISAAYADVGKEKLSDYGFFKLPLADLSPADHVFPYELNTPLFTDYALKKRFIFIPEGNEMVYREKEAFDFPAGSALIKNFYYDNNQLSDQAEKIIETRLLIHEEDGWKALPYIWNESQTEAFLQIAGGEQKVALHGKPLISYAVPNMVQCKSCHELNGTMAPIGPTARQLNREIHGKNQLLRLQEAGVLSGLPDIKTIQKIAVWDNKKTGTLNDRARAYLDINCGHCHRPEGPGKNSGLDLTLFSASDFSLGILKSPIAAGAGSGGLLHDIVPGKPEESILVYRMQSNALGVMMPELGRKLIHDEGVALIKEWIKSME